MELGFFQAATCYYCYPQCGGTHTEARRHKVTLSLCPRLVHAITRYIPLAGLSGRFSTLLPSTRSLRLPFYMGLRSPERFETMFKRPVRDGRMPHDHNKRFRLWI